MQLILDNIVASIVGSTVILIMMFVNHQSRIAATEAAGYYVMQKQVVSFTGMIQRDMQNLSAVQATTEIDSVFIFFSKVSPTDSTARQVQYRRTRIGEREVDGALVPIYHIERWVGGVQTGGSVPAIVDWDIQALSADGNPIAHPMQAGQISVGFRVVPPIDVQVIDGVTLGDTRWESVYRPRILRDNTL